MGRLENLRNLAVTQLRRNADVLYRHEAEWSDGTTCRYSVKDPQKLDTATARALRNDPAYDRPRLVTVHPDDEKPGTGATVEHEGRTLHLVVWTDVSDFTGQAVALCDLRDG